jgi:hypothetical protein
MSLRRNNRTPCLTLDGRGPARMPYRQAQAEMAADPSGSSCLDRDGDAVACEGLRGGTNASAVAPAGSPNPWPKREPKLLDPGL